MDYHITYSHGAWINEMCIGGQGTLSNVLCKSNLYLQNLSNHYSTKKPVTTMLTYPWKCTVLHCNHLGNTWKPLVVMTRHFDYCPSASESSAPVVSRCFPGGYNVKLYISRGRLAWWLLTFLHSATTDLYTVFLPETSNIYYMRS